MNKVPVGVIGCGMISEVYLKNLTGRFSDLIEVKACADLFMASAQKRAEQFSVCAMTVEDLIADPSIEFVLNLTPPVSHYSLNRQILLAGKHCYCEKPFADTVEHGRELLALADERGLLAAAAPDTFLGAGIQTAIRLVKDGVIGKPVAAQGYMLGAGPERFHPNPGFFYEKGAGPLLDMGPYYYTALAALFGPAKRVVGYGRRIDERRKVWNPESKLYPGTIPVEVDTYVEGMIEFESGVIANVTTSWDFDYAYFDAPMPLLAVLGTEGTMFMADPNTFGGTETNLGTGKIGDCVIVEKNGKRERMPLCNEYTDNSRGLGAYEMARAIRAGGEAPINGKMSLHVLEMMLGVLESAESGTGYTMTTTFA